MPLEPTSPLPTVAVPTAPAAGAPRRLGGWLILAMVGLCAWPFNLVAVSIPAFLAVREYGLAEIVAQDPKWLQLTAWSVGSAAALSALSLWTLANFWRKRRFARTLAIAFFASNLVVGVANYVIAAVDAAPGAPPPNMARVMLATGIAVAWIRYFTVSERVRETFVEP